MIIQANAFHIPLKDESVQMICTSPPYYGLRNYDLSPIIIGGDENCQHEWENEIIKKMRGTAGSGNTGNHSKRIAGQEEEQQQGQFCLKCNAWRGQLGLEPNIELYITHLVEVFRECWRVLRRDGIFFMNISDTYFGSGGVRGQSQDALNLGKTRKERYYAVEGIMQGKKHPILKPKDLCLIPERLIIALQEQGWWIRSKITICKRNPMPESVRDRPTNATEMLFLLTKSKNYFYDAEAVREKYNYDGRKDTKYKGGPKDMGIGKHERWPQSGRNLRNWWEIISEGFVDAHFATFGSWIWRCIAAGTSEKGCCVKCESTWKRVVEKKTIPTQRIHRGIYDLSSGFGKSGWLPGQQEIKTIGWQPSCKCHNQDGEDKIKPCIVFDPFGGSGTVKEVAERMGRKAIICDLKWEYLKMAQKRCNSNQERLKL